MSQNATSRVRSIAQRLLGHKGMSAATALLTVIGVAGIPGDAETLANWIAALLVWLSSGWGRLVALSIAALLGLYIFHDAWSPLVTKWYRLRRFKRKELPVIRKQLMEIAAEAESLLIERKAKTHSDSTWEGTYWHLVRELRRYLSDETGERFRSGQPREMQNGKTTLVIVPSGLVRTDIDALSHLIRWIERFTENIAIADLHRSLQPIYLAQQRESESISPA